MTRLMGIVGSLRKASLNGYVLRALDKHWPQGVQMQTLRLRGITPFDQDLMDSHGLPPVVTALREAIASADGVVIATPEYNYSIPGALKDAIDWVSRGRDQPLAGKPVGVVSASMGGFGGVRAQLHLRQMLLFLDARVMSRPEVMVPLAQQKFSTNGELLDAPTDAFLRDFAAAFAEWVERNGTRSTSS